MVIKKDKTIDQVQNRCYGIQRKIIRDFVRVCPVCNLKSIQHSQPPLHPIRSNDFWERVQIELVDMRNSPDDGHNYIAHVIDHFSNFNVICGLKTKSTEEVAEGFKKHVLSYFGLPSIMQSDNGLEFRNKTFQNLITGWDQGGCTIVHSRPRHPKTNGKVEQSNRTMEEMIAAFKIQNQTSKWVQFLPKVMYNMNTQVHSATKKTPYEIAFGLRANNGKKNLEIPEDLEIDPEDDLQAVIIPPDNVKLSVQKQ